MLLWWHDSQWLPYMVRLNLGEWGVYTDTDGSLCKLLLLLLLLQQKQQNNSTINNKTQLLLVRGVKHINPHRILRIKGLRWERRLRSRSTPRSRRDAAAEEG